VRKTDVRWMKVEEVAEFFELTPATIREWCRTGKIPATRPGRDWKILRSDVEAYAQREYGEN